MYKQHNKNRHDNGQIFLSLFETINLQSFVTLAWAQAGNPSFSGPDASAALIID